MLILTQEVLNMSTKQSINVKKKDGHLWTKQLSMHLLQAATRIYKSQKNKLLVRLGTLLLEPKSVPCCKMQQKTISPAAMTRSDSLLRPSLIQEPLWRPTTSSVSVPGRPAKPSAEANMLKWCACWTCKYDSWHPWRDMPIFFLSYTRKPNRRNARNGKIRVQVWLCSNVTLWETDGTKWMQKQYFHSCRFHSRAAERLSDR